MLYYLYFSLFFQTNIIVPIVSSTSFSAITSSKLISIGTCNDTVLIGSTKIKISVCQFSPLY